MSEAILGIDIAKQKFDVALLNNGKIKHKTLNNNKEGFVTLSQWLQKQGIEYVHACLEATGTYGDDLATYLHDAGNTVSMVNPARIKGFAQSELIRTKNDKVDAGLIARFCLAMRPKAWIPSRPEVRNLQAIVRRVDALIGIRVQETNRLSVSNAAVEESIKEHITYLDQEVEKLKKQIQEAMNIDPDLKSKRDLLISIPGISDATIAAVLAELNGLENFDNVQKLVAFIGLAPKDTISGDSIKGKPRICKIGTARLRKALYMPALSSIRCNPVIAKFYSRLKETGKNGKVIVCAVMRKLVHIMFGILKSGKPFNPNYEPIFA